ncbi:MAG: hypothetical protein LUQ12_05550 [Methanoregulaceae archaeon]|nr:hypothetical protein [Methanoregulaceae archaeon]
MTQECRKDQSATKALISGLIGIILFLIVLIIFSSIADYLSSPLFSGFVDLLYANAALVIIFSVLFMFGDIFAAFVFPFNLPFPLFNAAASVLLVSFILSIMEFIDSFYALGIGSSLQLVSLILYPLTFVIVLVAGYISIFYRNPGTCPPSSGQTDNNTPAEKPSWEEVGGEFRQMVFDFFRRIRNELNRK